jgi:ubiquinol-cytochrome c reductase cytochrome c1 subunit
MKMRKILLTTVLTLGLATSAFASGGEAHKLMSAGGSYNGIFGKFDRAQVQRGFQVYKEVCSSCHSMNQMHYRNLGEVGGPYYDAKFKNANDNPVVKAIAKGYTVKDFDASGNEIERAGLPSDKFAAPFESEAAAKSANGGALPPDLSVITKARHGGADYVYSLMMGYNKHVPHGVVVPEGKVYNPYMAGGIIGMPEQLTDGRVTYADTPENKLVRPTAEQHAKDIAAFLQWASDPHQTARKSAGIATLLFMFIFAIFTWFSYQSVWRNVKH